MQVRNVGVMVGSVCRGTLVWGRTMRQMYFYKQLVAKLRRFYLVHFKPGYVEKQLFLRKGQCRQCGKCCALLFTCPMLTQKGLCVVYGKCRPKACKFFPIDQNDVDEITSLGGECGYRFETSDKDEIAISK